MHNQRLLHGDVHETLLECDNEANAGVHHHHHKDTTGFANEGTSHEHDLNATAAADTKDTPNGMHSSEWHGPIQTRQVDCGTADK